MRVVSLNSAIENSFLRFLRSDVISNFQALQNLKFRGDKTKFWAAIEDTRVLAYLCEHDGKFLNLRGKTGCATELLKKTTLLKPNVSIEPEHLPVIKMFYKPTRGIGPNPSEVTTLLALEVGRRCFRPVTKHNAKKLTIDELDAFEKLYMKFGEETGLGAAARERVVKTLERGLIYGVHDEGELVSFAAGRILENVGHVAPVYTSPKFREKGYATSACSALVDELLDQCERVILFARADDPAALRLYKKLGFTETGHRFLTFWARKIEG